MSFPLVTLGLAMLPEGGLEHLSVWHWMMWDVCWSSGRWHRAWGADRGYGRACRCVFANATCASARTRRISVAWRDRHGLGGAQLCDASGFLAVFAAGLVLQRVQNLPRRGTAPWALLRAPSDMI
jgi:hypothetical protein